MLAECHTSTNAQYAGILAEEIESFAALVDKTTDFAARVPTCPDWTIADLIEHLGSVHRWAYSLVSTVSTKRIPSASVQPNFPQDPAEYAGWIREGGAKLVPAVRDVDPGAPMWAWGLDQHARFWGRRQVHETAVHRVDLATAVGSELEIPNALCVDGIDEFLDNLPCAAYFAPDVKKLRGEGERIALVAPAARWTIELGPDGFTWSHETVDVAVTVTGDAQSLLLWSWGRSGFATVEVAGDTAVLDRWTKNASI